MKDGKCPMCQSAEVYVNTSHHFFLDLHADALKKGADPMGSVQAGAVAYVCKNCGYVAFFVNDVAGRLDDLPEARGWQKVG